MGGMRSLLLLLLCTLPSLAQEARVVGLVYSTQASSTSLHGQEYVEGAEVRIGEQKAKTDMMGIFELKNVPAGRQTLIVEKDGFITARVEIEVAAGPLPVQTKVALTPTSGRVTAGRGTAYIGCRARPVMKLQTTQWFRGMSQFPDVNVFELATNPPLDPEIPHTLGDNPATFDENVIMMLPDSPTQTKLHRLASTPNWLCFTRDGSALYTSYDSYIEVSDPALHTPLATIPLTGGISSLQRCGDFMLATQIGAVPAVVLIDTRTHTVQSTCALPAQPSAAQLVGDRLYVTVYNPHDLSDPGQVVCLDRTGAVLGSTQVGATPTAIVRSGDRLLVVNAYSGSVTALDFDLKVVKTIPVGVTPQRLAVSPDGGTRAFVTNRGSRSVSIIDTRSLSVTSTTHVGKFPVDVAFSLDGSRAWVACTGDGTVRILDGRSGEQLHATNPLPLSCPFAVAVRP